MAIHRMTISYGDGKKLEKGRRIRHYSTVVETDIHSSTDSALLWDGVRIITRWLIKGKRFYPKPLYLFSDHRRVVKKRLFAIQNTKSKKARKAAYRDMLHYASIVCTYAELAASELYCYEGGEDVLDIFRARSLAGKLERAVNLLKKVVDQTERRVFKGKKVPATEKIVSLFETHTDIIVKGNRNTEYGHKIFLTGGVSNLIIDCLIEKGNPADSDCFHKLQDRQKDYYGRLPRQTSQMEVLLQKPSLLMLKRRK